MKTGHSKMTPEELAVWLHLNRKAHAIKSGKTYDRNRAKRDAKKD